MADPERPSRSPFDRLRVNGEGAEGAEPWPGSQLDVRISQPPQCSLWLSVPMRIRNVAKGAKRGYVYPELRGGRMVRSPIEVVRFSSLRENEVAGLLPELYEIDVRAFSKPEDQYGLDLLWLALHQPEAFWVARASHRAIGYLSVFFFQTERLYQALRKQAQEGTLNLPQLKEDYAGDFARGELGCLHDLHVYIDAVAVRPAIRKRGFGAIKVVNALVSQAAVDTSTLRWTTICTVVTNPDMVKYMKFVGQPLELVGGRRESVAGDGLFRQFYHRVNERDSSGGFRRGFSEALRFLSGRVAGRVGFKPSIGISLTTGEPTLGVTLELEGRSGTGYAGDQVAA